MRAARTVAGFAAHPVLAVVCCLPGGEHIGMASFAGLAVDGLRVIVNDYRNLIFKIVASVVNCSQLEDDGPVGELGRIPSVKNVVSRQVILDSAYGAKPWRILAQPKLYLEELEGGALNIDRSLNLYRAADLCAVVRIGDVDLARRGCGKCHRSDYPDQQQYREARGDNERDALH